MSEFIDVKKAQKDFIRTELRPVLYEQGFVLSKPTTYVRERDGLLQEFYFKVETYKLRPWVSVRPVFDARNIVTFGADNIYTQDAENPCYGYGWVTFGVGQPVGISEWNEKILPKLFGLKSSIVNGVLPELNVLGSLDVFLQFYKENGLLFGKRIQSDTKMYFDFIAGVCVTEGMERMTRILNEMEPWDLQNLPKDVREYLQSCKDKLASDVEADKIFDEYCDKIRVAYKLI